MMTDWKEGEKLLLLAQFDMRRKITVAEKKEFHNNSYCAKPWICPLGVSGTKVSFPLRQKTLRIVEVYFYSELIASDIIRLEEKELFFGLSSGGVPLFYHGKWRIFSLCFALLFDKVFLYKNCTFSNFLGGQLPLSTLALLYSRKRLGRKSGMAFKF